MTDYTELRRLTIPHQADARCQTCDDRWAGIEQEAERVVGARVLAVLARRARRRRRTVRVV